jgi:hypothetical protein|tara:strand:- start:427 stop:654 length:228 start_codon:yes stop_codon:yes gene_type:complete
MWKDEIKKRYIGYSRDKAELEHNAQMLEEDLAGLMQDFITDLQEAISGGRVTDSKLKKIFKKHNIEFDLLKLISE